MKPKTGGKKLEKVYVKTLKKVLIITTEAKYKSVCVCACVCMGVCYLLLEMIVYICTLSNYEAQEGSSWVWEIHIKKITSWVKSLMNFFY